MSMLAAICAWRSTILAGLRARLTEAGYTPTDTIPIPGRPRFVCDDPFGNPIEFTTIE